MQNILEILKAIIFGIVEGITEWLPISSTGHLILVNQIMKFNDVVSQNDFFEMFDVVIQLGAIMAVVILFWYKIWPFYKTGNMETVKGGLKKSKKDPSLAGVSMSMDAFWMWVKIVVACLPAVIYGVLLDDAVSEAFAKKIGDTNVTIEVFVVAAMLIIVGVLFIIIERKNKGKVPAVKSVSGISFTAALIIGVAQLLAAALPGTSRSGATILAAILIGISRKAAAEFTFFLGIPVMFGASLLKIVKFLKDGTEVMGIQVVVLLVGTVVSFIVSLFVVNMLMGYIKKHDFQAFGWYRIALGIVVVLVSLIQVL